MPTQKTRKATKGKAKTTKPKVTKHEVPTGRWVWYDLMTTDPAAATRFYTTLVGWQTHAWDQDASYTMWTNGGMPLGGLQMLPEEARKAGSPPHWLAYVATPDVDATAKQATSLGAQIYVGPMDIPTVGRFCVMADPQGAIFAAFAPAEEAPGHDGPPQLGEISWHELATSDPDGAFKFYNKLFGWKKGEAMDMGEAGPYQMYSRKGQDKPLGGIFKKPAEMPGPSAWLYYAKVKDVTESAKHVQQLGGHILNGPMEVPGGDMIVQCMDPQGAAFALHSSAS